MEEKRSKIKDLLKGILSNGGYVIGLVFICTLIIVAVINLGTTIDIIGRFLTIVAPFIFGFFFAYLIRPIVVTLEKPLKKIKKGKGEKIKRVISIVVSYLIIIGALTVIIVYIFPQMKNSVKDIGNSVKNGYNYVTNHLDEMNAMIPIINLGNVIEYIQNNLIDKLMSNSGTIVPFVYRFSSSVLTSLYNIFMGLVISIYMIIDGQKLKNSIKRIIYAVSPIEKAPAICKTISKCNHIFNGFLFGKAVDSLIIGILCFIAMSILQLPYSLLLSVIVGITNMIPYFGPIIGAIPGFVIYLFIDPKLSLVFAIMILILQQFDGLYLGPKILGDLTGIKPLWVIFGIVIGGAYFGAVGMFLGVPTVAVFMYLADLFIESKLKKKKIDLSDMK
jgi:predicted PurR-regulated permease PerM